MSMITHTRAHTGSSATFVVNWTGLGQNDVGDAMPFSQYADKSAQVVGVFGGAALRIEGSNNGDDWSVLTDPQGNDLSFTTAKIEMVTEATLQIRPKVSGGDGTTALSVHLLCKEAR